MENNTIQLEGLQRSGSSMEIQEKDKIHFDLSGNNWQMEGILPGRGVALGFHELPPDITGDAFNWAYGKVPGDVYTDLWRSGRIDDPHYARNSMKAKWIPELEWWYKRQFDVPTEMKDKKIHLVFEGVDYACDVWLNGQFLGTHEGMFSEFSFEVTDIISFLSLRHGSNVLMVRLHPAPRRYSMVAGRKPAWHGDYWVSLPPTGIWRPVRLEAMGEIAIKDTYVKSSIQTAGSASLNVQIVLENPLNHSREVEIAVLVKGHNFESEDDTIKTKKLLSRGVQQFDIPIEVTNPKLWWPWDMGEQNLYQATVEIKDANGAFYDRTHTTFGIREVKMAMNPGYTEEEVENPWTVMINGQRHFMRSGTWGGPPDIFFGRASEDKYRELIRLAKEANLNNLRIFGWHPVEIPLFYQLCNEAGITVWQDVLPLASLSLPKDQAFKEAVFQEAIAVVKQQRNHPCLVLLEGSEELFMTAADPKFNLEFVNELGKAIRPYTPLHFLPSSPLSDEVGLALGFKPNESYHANDLFYAEGRLIMEEYFPALDYAVIPEMAISSCPNVESIKKFIPENELWPPGPSWGHHWTDFDVLQTLNFEVLGDQSTSSMETFVKATQIAQGTIFQFALEHFRRRKPRTSAICICHYITFAPDMKWGIVDYYREKKRSYDYVKRAYQPLLVNLQYDKRRWLPNEEFIGRIWVVNDYLKDYQNCKTIINFLDQDKHVFKTDEVSIAEIAADSSKEFATVSCKVPGKMGDKFYVEISLVNDQGNEISANHYLLLVADQEAAKSSLKAIGAEAIELKYKYGVANYYRYFKGLGGEPGAKEADEEMPRATGF